MRPNTENTEVFALVVAIPPPQEEKELPIPTSGPKGTKTTHKGSDLDD